MREVEHVHQAEDQRKPRRDQEVQRAEPEAGHQRAGRAYSCVRTSRSWRRRAARASGRRRRAARGADRRISTTRPGSMTTASAAMRRTTAGSARPAGRSRRSATRASTSPTSVTSLRGQALRRLVDQQQLVVGRAAPGPAPPSAAARRRGSRPAACGAAATPGRARRPVVVGLDAGRSARRQVLLHRQRGEHLAVLRHVADARPDDPMGAAARRSVAAVEAVELDVAGGRPGPGSP